MNKENNLINGVEINLDQVHALISENRKLEAVKYVMDQAKIGLLEAKNFVDELRNKEDTNTVDNDLMEQIKTLLKQNKKIEAVKLVKSATGMGLKESKDFVENIDHPSFKGLFEKFTGERAVNLTEEKTVKSTGKSEKKSTLFVEEPAGKSKIIFIALLIIIAAIVFYFYQK